MARVHQIPELNPEKWNEDGTLKKYTFWEEDELVVIARENEP